MREACHGKQKRRDARAKMLRGARRRRAMMRAPAHGDDEMPAPMVVVEIWDPMLEHRSQAVAWTNACLAKVQEALTHCQGQVSNGSIQGVSASGVPHSELA